MQDRAFISFISKAGTLIATSHGLFFSHSDIDYRANNPLLSRPPVDEFRKFTPLDATDPTIQLTAEMLWDRYGAWDAIPALHENVVFDQVTPPPARRGWFLPKRSLWGEFLPTTFLGGGTNGSQPCTSTDRHPHIPARFCRLPSLFRGGDPPPSNPPSSSPPP